MRLPAVLAAALGLSLATPRPAAAGDPAALNQAAGLYHQARYDSARVRLEALLAEGSWRRRDSLVLLQYLGMSWSRLGRDSAAEARFADLLAVDSLFRLPRNEDPAILRNFGAALDRRNVQVTTVAPRPPIPHSLAPQPPAPEASPASAPAASLGAAPGGPSLAVSEPAAMPATAPATASAALPAASQAAHRPDPAPGLAAALRGAVPEAGNPLRDPAPAPRPMNLALGAVPLGGGWLARKRVGHGVSLGLVQAGGLLLSIYASERQSRAQDDPMGLQASERGSAVGWQWVQRVSLSTAVGAYLYSIIASGGD